MQRVTEIYILNNKELFILQNVFHLFSIAFVNVLHAASTYSKNMICSKLKVLNQFQQFDIFFFKVQYYVVAHLILSCGPLFALVR